jgi:hypothetical protein
MRANCECRSNARFQMPQVFNPAIAAAARPHARAASSCEFVDQNNGAWVRLQDELVSTFVWRKRLIARRRLLAKGRTSRARWHERQLVHGRGATNAPH